MLPVRCPLASPTRKCDTIAPANSHAARNPQVLQWQIDGFVDYADWNRVALDLADAGVKHHQPITTIIARYGDASRSPPSVRTGPSSRSRLLRSSQYRVRRD